MRTPTTLIAIAAVCILWSCTKVEEVGGCQFPKSYELVWQDEFNGAEIDSTKWSYDLGDGCQLGENLCGWGNNELQYYTDRPENAKVENGSLVLTAIKESPLYLGMHEYTSARMVTKNRGDWKYGRIDVRAKIPTGQGIWSAIWMLPTDTVYGGWPKSGEIDIMENIGSEPKKILGTIHYGHDFWQFDSQELEIDEGFYYENFHVYSVLWNEQCIQFLMDDQEVGVPNTRSTVLPTTYPFDQLFHAILNIAVGGNLPGNPSPTTPFPQRMEVDYVRVYQ